jgi:cellulose synthase/poly-beta-1,6-N-acetylglucosamine synthase-like glycosyltransferase
MLGSISSILFFLCILGLILQAGENGYLFWRHRFRKTEPLQALSKYPSGELPFNIVQLPVFNEDIALVQRLVTSACSLDYPRDRLLIQLLDDSDDQRIAGALNHWVANVRADHLDLDLTYHHRSDRRDYKAGNLNHGLAIAKQTLQQRGYVDAGRIIVSVFDADFTIPSDYLRQTVHYFSSAPVGAVQALLGFSNRNLNLITQAQAQFMSNLHDLYFGTRSRSGHLTTFLGSAGSWRLQAIEEAGGWQGDTQVEDVDISVAAQLKGWQILYLSHLRVPCQLPADANTFKLQQRSWMKGYMEVIRKRCKSLLVASQLTTRQRVMAMGFFLILPFQALFVILGHLLIIPTHRFMQGLGHTQWSGALFLGLLCLFCFTHFPMLMAGVGRRTQLVRRHPSGFWRRFKRQAVAFGLIPSSFPALTYGLLEGLLGVEVHRDRTLKSVDPILAQSSRLSPGQRGILARIFIFEFAMSLYSLAFVIWAAHAGEWGMGGLLSVLIILYAGSAWATLRALVRAPAGRE